MMLKEAANAGTEIPFSAVQRTEGLICTARRDQFAPYRISTARGVYLQTFKSFRAESRFLKNWVSATLIRAADTLFSGPRVFAISTTFQAESRQDQNMKVVHLRSRNKAQVESRRTIQCRMRKARRRRLGLWFFRQKQGMDSSPNIFDSGTNQVGPFKAKL